MSVTNINISVDSELRDQAQSIFASMGLDMSSAIDIFLRQSVQQHSIPFVVTVEQTETVQPVKKTPKPGCMRGKIWMADDFDAPLEDFKEYM